MKALKEDDIWINDNGDIVITSFYVDDAQKFKQKILQALQENPKLKEQINLLNNHIKSLQIMLDKYNKLKAENESLKDSAGY